MLEADELCMPDIVKDNYAAHVMSASLEYLVQNPRSVLQTLHKHSSLRKGPCKTPISVLQLSLIKYHITNCLTLL